MASSPPSSSLTLDPLPPQSPPRSSSPPPTFSDCSPPFSLNGDDPLHGFSRPDMFQSSLVGSVQLYERHIFLCFKDPRSWPPQVEASEFYRLPRLLAAGIKARKNDMPKRTRLTICEGRDGTDSSNGDVLIFPDMVQYRGLTHFDVDTFVEEVLVHNKEWPSGRPERLVGTHVFVCSHGSRDARCGVCGPVLIQKFKSEISSRALESHVFVRPSSHVGGHKYAGNVIIYSSNAAGEVAGHWYGYVIPDDVPILLDEHIIRGNIVDRIWRGQMGLGEDEQKQAQQHRFQLKNRDLLGEKNEKEGCICCKEQEVGHVNGEVSPSFDNCCEDAEGGKRAKERGKKNERSDQGRRQNGFWSSWKRVSSLFEAWEGEDTFAALAVIGAAASVGVAYHLYKHSS